MIVKKSYRVRRSRRTLSVRLPSLAVGILLADRGYISNTSVSPGLRRQVVESHLLYVAACIARSLVDDVLEGDGDWSTDEQLAHYSGVPSLAGNDVRAFIEQYNP